MDSVSSNHPNFDAIMYPHGTQFRLVVFFLLRSDIWAVSKPSGLMIKGVIWPNMLGYSGLIILHELGICKRAWINAARLRTFSIVGSCPIPNLSPAEASVSGFVHNGVSSLRILVGGRYSHVSDKTPGPRPFWGRTDSTGSWTSSWGLCGAAPNEEIEVNASELGINGFLMEHPDPREYLKKNPRSCQVFGNVLRSKTSKCLMVKIRVSCTPSHKPIRWKHAPGTWGKGSSA